MEMDARPDCLHLNNIGGQSSEVYTGQPSSGKGASTLTCQEKTLLSLRVCMQIMRTIMVCLVRTKIE